VDWGNFNAPLRNDHANAPHKVQTETQYTPVAMTFTMSDGMITAVTSDGSTVGLLMDLMDQNSRLEFATSEGLPKPTQERYCLMVSTEKLVFFVTGLITSHQNL
jgi:hypothetical protein